MMLVIAPAMISPHWLGLPQIAINRKPRSFLLLVFELLAWKLGLFFRALSRRVIKKGQC